MQHRNLDSQGAFGHAALHSEPRRKVFRQLRIQIRVTLPGSIWEFSLLCFVLWRPVIEGSIEADRSRICCNVLVQMPPKHLRRSHTKSKKGCSQCKVRRIKVRYDIRRSMCDFLIRQHSVTKLVPSATIASDARSHVILNCRQKNDKLPYRRGAPQKQIVNPTHLPSHFGRIANQMDRRISILSMHLILCRSRSRQLLMSMTCS